MIDIIKTGGIAIEETEESKTFALLRKALDDCDKEKTAEIMAELLMDDTVSSYEMFEDASYDYLHGNADYRKGMDQAFSILIGHNLSETAKEMLRRKMSE